MNKLKIFFVYTPQFTGSVIGGSYFGYQRYCNYQHVSEIATAIIAGGTCGFLAGTFWFVGATFLINRKYKSIVFDGEDIFTIYKK